MANATGDRDEFDQIANGIEATTTLALTAADALDQATAMARDYEDSLTTLASEDDLGAEDYQLRAGSGFNTLNRVLQVYQAWIHRLFAGNVVLKGDALISADDLRAEVRRAIR